MLTLNDISATGLESLVTVVGMLQFCRSQPSTLSERQGSGHSAPCHQASTKNSWCKSCLRTRALFSLALQRLALQRSPILKIKSYIAGCCYYVIIYIVSIYNFSNVFVFVQSLLFISKLNLYVFHKGLKGTFIKAELKSH